MFLQNTVNVQSLLVMLLGCHENLTWLKYIKKIRVYDCTKTVFRETTDRGRSPEEEF